MVRIEWVERTRFAGDFLTADLRWCSWLPFCSLHLRWLPMTPFRSSRCTRYWIATAPSTATVQTLCTFRAPATVLCESEPIAGGQRFSVRSDAMNRHDQSHGLASLPSLGQRSRSRVVSLYALITSITSASSESGRTLGKRYLLASSTTTTNTGLPTMAATETPSKNDIPSPVASQPTNPINITMINTHAILPTKFRPRIVQVLAIRIQESRYPGACNVVGFSDRYWFGLPLLRTHAG